MLFSLLFGRIGDVRVLFAVASLAGNASPANRFARELPSAVPHGLFRDTRRALSGVTDVQIRCADPRQRCGAAALQT
jgi:hypothetical protein